MRRLYILKGNTSTVSIKYLSLLFVCGNAIGIKFDVYVVAKYCFLVVKLLMLHHTYDEKLKQSYKRKYKWMVLLGTRIP